ncbi:hypothetical protein M5K25_016671 [Dendrobium thyrsiflorum]|uniref:Sulfhydryl oxidase n=1 Tax=Dendrobium thyrsiflorum TaxID=117978 RepID=A0ABD0USF0_DENTH
MDTNGKAEEYLGSIDHSIQYALKNPGSEVKTYTLDYVKKATCCYQTLIGEGGFGTVYRGTLSPGQEVVVKVRSATSVQGTREFDNEVVPAAMKFRFNGIPPELEEKLKIMFSRIVATGENVWIPNSGILPSELRNEQHNSSEEDDLHDDDPQVEISNGEEATFTTASQRFQSSATFVKGKRAKTVKLAGKQLFVNHIESLVNAAQSVSSTIATSSTQRRTVTILDAVTEISGIPEIYDDLEFYEFAIEFLKDKDSRESFMGIPRIDTMELMSNIYCSCGLWILLHSISVRIGDGEAQLTFTVIRDFIHNFFRCEECRRHFDEMCSSAPVPFNTTPALVLWLWSSHNNVNERLIREEKELGTGDPRYPKMIWPPKELCPSCLVSSSSVQMRCDVENVKVKGEYL